MRTNERRVSFLEARRQPSEPHPGRIPDWFRPWIDPLTDADLEILEIGLSHEEAGGDLADLPPETRERFEALYQSYVEFSDEHRPEAVG